MMANDFTEGAPDGRRADNGKVMPLGAGTGTKIVEDTIVGRHGAIAVRRYLPATPTPGEEPLVWLHGGAFSHGDLDQLESHAPALTIAAAGRPVVTVDYRRVPPWSWLRRPKPGVLDGIRFPVTVEDVIDAFEHIRAETPDGRVILGGASAGACLAAAATLRLQRAGGKTPARLMLAYGTFHAALPAVSRELRSRIRGRHGIVQFRPGTVDRMNRNYAGSLQAMSNPFAFPGGHDLTGLPPTLVVDADRDSLRASGAAFAHDLARAGVPVAYEVIAGSTHGFLDRPETAHFDAGMDVILRWLSFHPGPKGQNQEPTKKGISR
jgi:acetyl esterase